TPEHAVGLRGQHALIRDEQQQWNWRNAPQRRQHVTAANRIGSSTLEKKWDVGAERQRDGAIFSIELAEYGCGVRRASAQSPTSRYLFLEMHARRHADRLGGPQHEIRIVGWNRRIIASQRRRVGGFEPQLVVQRNRLKERFDVVIAVRAFAGDAQR